MKKLLLSTITLFSLAGVTACGKKEKKLSAEEAKAKLTAIAKAQSEVTSSKLEATFEANAKGTLDMGGIQISPDVAIQGTTLQLQNGNNSYSKNNVKTSIAGLDAFLGGVSGANSILEQLAKGTDQEEYTIVNGKEMMNISLTDGKVVDAWKYTFIEDKTEEDTDITTEISETLTEMSKYFNMEAFHMKGNTLTADKTIIDKDKLVNIAKDEDVTINADDIQIKFNKFELELNDDNTIKAGKIDIEVKVKTTTEVEGQKLSVDVTSTLSVSLTASYETQTITVPADVLSKAEEAMIIFD